MNRKSLIIDLMGTSTIDGLELIGAEWPLRWASPIFNDQYDFDVNPLGLSKEYEHSGSDESKMLSLHSEIIIHKNEHNIYTIEDGALYTESHVWCKEINFNTAGSLPLYNKKDMKDFENLLSELVVVGSTVNLALGTDVGISCRRDQDELDNIIDYEEFYGEIIELKLERGCVIVADDDTGHEYHAKIEDLFST